MSLLKKLYFKLFPSREQRQREEIERTAALANATEHPIYKAILSYADEHARNEHEAALAANLTNEQRQYNAGRSASAYDFALALRELQARAAARVEKEKRKE